MIDVRLNSPGFASASTTHWLGLVRYRELTLVKLQVQMPFHHAFGRRVFGDLKEPGKRECLQMVVTANFHLTE
jgi:hypothetical protein